ncbi:ligase-associated DNA damage response endonuclease PdeM [Algoriphagus hitonicola]|uniref:Putative phosphoesterase n=1 Tax=Algoriphagus hitonicola TaxID=435880 RepID=A0A1I2RC63_9BACT|nr:ligase-associated DNA damage response endonuclease PdeM [Algoriphagus hitonicola]SFG37643.1 putative phosphoesterase [Algoriphagus hitonicola]
MNQVQITHQKTELTLLKEKGLWISALSSLFIADLHFGKAAHFRKSGIPIPEPIHSQDLEKLDFLIRKYQPSDIYFLGDLFHSDWNDQWGILMDFFQQFSVIHFHLIQGNHDILPKSVYASSPIKVHQQPIHLGDFTLSHEPLEEILPNQLNICGHIHPGVRLRGLARQSLRIPCFYWDQNQLILPAFGNFTGLAIMNKTPTSKIFGVTEKKVIPILSEF